MRQQGRRSGGEHESRVLLLPPGGQLQHAVDVRVVVVQPHRQPQDAPPDGVANAVLHEVAVQVVHGGVVGGIVVMRWGENALNTIAAVKEKIARLKQGLPEGVELIETYVRTHYSSRFTGSGA